MDNKDHDMLIKLDQKVNTLCTVITKLTEDNTTQHTTIIESKTDERKETDRKIGRKTDVWVFRTALAVIATVIMGISYNINENNKNITSIVSEFEDHSAFASIAWEKFTGQSWGAVSRIELNEAKQKYQLERKLAKEREAMVKQNGN